MTRSRQACRACGDKVGDRVPALTRLQPSEGANAVLAVAAASVRDLYRAFRQGTARC